MPKQKKKTKEVEDTISETNKSKSIPTKNPIKILELLIQQIMNTDSIKVLIAELPPEKRIPVAIQATKMLNDMKKKQQEEEVSDADVTLGHLKDHELYRLIGKSDEEYDKDKGMFISQVRKDSVGRKHKIEFKLAEELEEGEDIVEPFDPYEDIKEGV